MKSRYFFRFRLAAICWVLLQASCTTSSNFDRGYLIPDPGGVVEIPITTVRGLVLMDVVVNGTPGRFLFDNGFSYGAVNDEFAARAGIIFDGRFSSSRDANNRQRQVRETTVDTVKIGGHRFVETGFYRVDTRKFLPCDSLDGIIGAAMINKANWEIDFDQRQMRVAAKPFDREGWVLPVDVSNNNSNFTSLTIGDRKVRCKIDFGYTGNVKLIRDDFLDFFRGARAEERVGVSSFSSNGQGQRTTVHRLADSVAVGVGDQKLPIGARVQLMESLKYPGYLGVDFFNDYTVIINSTSGEYILEREGSPVRPRGNKSYGLSLYPIENRWTVLQLNPYDPLLAGVAPMTEVLAIDDIPVDSFPTVCVYYDYLREKMRREEELRVSLEGKELRVPYAEPVYVTLE